MLFLSGEACCGIFCVGNGITLRGLLSSFVCGDANSTTAPRPTHLPSGLTGKFLTKKKRGFSMSESKSLTSCSRPGSKLARPGSKLAHHRPEKCGVFLRGKMLTVVTQFYCKIEFSAGKQAILELRPLYFRNEASFPWRCALWGSCSFCGSHRVGQLGLAQSHLPCNEGYDCVQGQYLIIGSVFMTGLGLAVGVTRVLTLREQVKVHYTGGCAMALCSTLLGIRTNAQKNKEFEVVMGEGKVIQGWKQATSLARTSRWTLMTTRLDESHHSIRWIPPLRWDESLMKAKEFSLLLVCECST
eukprot:g64437.t1